MTCSCDRSVVEIGCALPQILLRIVPGHDYSWEVTATDADGADLTGDLVLTIGELELEEQIVDGTVTFVLDKDDATESLIDARVTLDWISEGNSKTAIAEGVVIRA
jgi:hypothetical protein